jgi:hypothetical protein
MYIPTSRKNTLHDTEYIKNYPHTRKCFLLLFGYFAIEISVNVQTSNDQQIIKRQKN